MDKTVVASANILGAGGSMNRPIKSIIIILVALIFVMGSLGSAPKSENNLSSFWTVDINGNEVTEQIFSSSKLTMVNVWATYCPPCLKEMPDLGELSKEYDSSLFQIVGIVTDVYHPNQRVFQQNLVTANDIIYTTGADYTHLLPSQELYELRLKNVQFVPETFFVDSKGRIVGETYISLRSKQEWKKIIESTLTLVK
jgi:thiol-disulfide isomerase/thioredoxin